MHIFLHLLQLILHLTKFCKLCAFLTILQWLLIAFGECVLLPELKNEGCGVLTLIRAKRPGMDMKANDFKRRTLELPCKQSGRASRTAARRMGA